MAKIGDFSHEKALLKHLLCRGFFMGMIMFLM